MFTTVDDERRRHQRLETVLQARCRNQTGNPTEAIVLDISHEGCQLVMDHSSLEENVFTLDIHLESDKSVSVQASRRWTREIDERNVLMGLSFKAPPPVRHRIHNWLNYRNSIQTSDLLLSHLVLESIDPREALVCG